MLSPLPLFRFLSPAITLPLSLISLSLAIFAISLHIPPHDADATLTPFLSRFAFVVLMLIAFIIYCYAAYATDFAAAAAAIADYCYAAFADAAFAADAASPLTFFHADDAIAATP